MVFSRQPVLKLEVEAQLKDDLRPLWRKGDQAKKIAKELNFGKPGPYKKLKPYHVYFYRSKFNFHRRRKPTIEKGTRRYKVKHEEIMLFQTFRDTLNEKIPKSTNFHTQRKRTYLILHYWTPLRKSEIYERTIDDLEIDNNVLTIDLYRKKKYYKPTAESEPINIPLEMPMMDEVVQWLQERKWATPSNSKMRPWKISCTTALNYVSEVFEGYYPHFFRFSFITKAIENTKDPSAIITKVMAKTGLNLVTVTKYVMKNKKYSTSIDKRELEILKEQGIIV